MDTDADCQYHFFFGNRHRQREYLRSADQRHRLADRGYIHLYADEYGCTDTKTVKVTVYGKLNGGTINGDQTICYGFSPGTLTATAASGGSGGFTYQWRYYNGSVWNNVSNVTTEDYAPGNLTATTKYCRIATNACGDVSSDTVTITVNPLPDAPTANNYTTCYDGSTYSASATPTVSGEDIVWYDAATGETTASEPTRSEVGTTTAYAAAKNTSTGCESATRTEVTVTVNPKPDYPDVRVEVCAGSSNINLSKYIDTVGSPTLVWTGYSIDDVTGIIASIPSSGGTYTYTYRVSAVCLAADADRKVYLRVVKNNKVFFPHDTIAVCYEQAEALQMNQIFGVEAEGTWITSPNLMNSAYIHQSTAPSIHAGATVFNGKAAYGAGVLTSITYQGKPAEAIEFYYTVPTDCLQGVYKVVVVLYER
jgi:hypothetical protein